MIEGPKNMMICPACGGEVPVRGRLTTKTGLVRDAIHSLGRCPSCGKYVERVAKYDWKNGGKFMSEKTHLFGPGSRAKAGSRPNAG